MSTRTSPARNHAAVSSPRVHMTGSQWFSTTAGGLNRYFTDLYEALHGRSDIDVSAAAFGEPEPGGQSWGPSEGSTLSRFRTSYWHAWDIPRGTIIDRHFCLYGRPAAVPGRRHPLVVHFHGPWAAEAAIAGSSKRNVRAKYLMERMRYSRADRVVVLSQHFRQLLVDDYGIAEDRVQVIPPGVNLRRFGAALGATSPAGGPRTVLCVRRLDPRMGIDVLLRAWRTVQSGTSDIRLAIVGSGDAEADLRRLTDELGVAETVTFEGLVDDDELVTMYGSAALTVVPSIALEGFGLIALESLAAGRAPVVTDCGGLPDAVRGLDQSLVVPAGDAAALADRLLAALGGDLPDAERCRTHAESFSWNRAAERHVAMYAELT